MSEVITRPDNEIVTIDQEPATTTASILALVARAASDPACDIDKMKALLDMQREVRADQARVEFAAAFSQLAGRIPNIAKRGEVLHGSGQQKTLAFKYTKWDDVMKALTPLLEEYGFSLTFESAPRPGDGGGLVITGHLLHRGGHEKTASMALPLDTGPGRSNIQAIGSTLSYGQKYVAKMLLNLVFGGEDNDGAGGTQGFITRDQVKELDALLLETGSNIGKWLEVIGATSVEEIPYTAFPMAKNSLIAKKRQMEAKRAGAAA